MAGGNTKVVIQSFKDTGKWNCEYIFNTDIEVYESSKLENECMRQYPNLLFLDFTFKAESEDGLNFRLVTKN